MDWIPITDRLPPFGKAVAFLLLLTAALCLSCGESSDKSIVAGQFVVRFDPIEGGCWNLVATDNSIYGPTNLDNAYQIDGLRVTASLQLLPYTIILCSGAPVQIIEIAPAP